MLALMLLVTLAGAAPSVWAQPETDIATGIPQLVVVEVIDADAGIVTLDGNVYRVTAQDLRAPTSISPNGRSLNLSDLEPGMEILVSTDGTEPSRSNRPQVLGMWKPR